jgi:hypothetical protein
VDLFPLYRRCVAGTAAFEIFVGIFPYQFLTKNPHISYFDFRVYSPRGQAGAALALH